MGGSDPRLALHGQPDLLVPWAASDALVLRERSIDRESARRSGFEARGEAGNGSVQVALLAAERSRPTISAVAVTCGQKRVRSAMPPDTMAGIAAAKVSRKKNFTRS